jgi:predicted ester cyclase
MSDRPAISSSGSPNKEVVRRLVDEVMNARRFDLLVDLASPRLAPKLRIAYEDFAAAFPDWRQEILRLVEEGDTVVAHMRCTGTQGGDWQGTPATGRRMDVDEVAFLTITDGRIARYWVLEDTDTRKRQLAGDDAALGDLGSAS